MGKRWTAQGIRAEDGGGGSRPRAVPLRWAGVVVAWGVLALLGRQASAEGTVDYLKQVKPILAKHCVSCHGEERQ